MNGFTGTGQLVRLIARRDRIRIPVWVLAITVLTAVSGNAVRTFYDTPVKVLGYEQLVASSGTTKLMNGRPYGVDTIAGITAYEVTMTALVAIGLMTIFLVVRHTRAEEESGRAELLRGTVTGRHAAMLAAMLVATLASVVVGLLDTVALVANELPADGSVLHGAALAGVGLVFAGVAAVAAQVTAGARGALGLAGAVLGVTFVLRAIGDLAGNPLTYLSPLGWAQAVQPYGDPQWWPLAALVALVVALFGGAAWLAAHRDAGSGLLHPRPGRPRATAALASPLGLPWRLQRASVLSWSLGLGVGGVLFGSIGPEVVDLVESNPEIAEVLGGAGVDILDAYFATTVAVLAVIGSGFAVSSALRLHAEESSGRAEALLATGVSRAAWALGGFAVTIAGTLLTLVAAGFGTGVSYAAASGEWGSAAPLAWAVVSLAPATLALAAAAVLLTGWWPRLALLSWAALAFAFVQIYLGELLRFPDWLSRLSPYFHLPQLPLEEFTAAPALWLLLLVVALVGAGVAGLRRRDLG